MQAPFKPRPGLTVRFGRTEAAGALNVGQPVPLTPASHLTSAVGFKHDVEFEAQPSRARVSASGR
jgi:hypothetical protein